MAVDRYGSAADHAALTGLNLGDPHTQYSSVLSGTAAARPAVNAAGLRLGSIYIATDTGVVTVYSGTAWVLEDVSAQQARGDLRYARLLADNILSGRNSFQGPVELAPQPANAFPLQYEPAGTNFVLNPSFEVDVSNWTAFGCTLTRVTTDFQFGAAAGQFVTTTATGQEGIFSNSVPCLPGEVWTASARVRVPVGTTARVLVRFLDSVGAQLVAFAGYFFGSGWQTLSGTYPAPANAAAVRVEIDDNFSATASTILVDGVQLERSPVPTSYIDGSLGTGFAWTGATNASSSTRAANTVARRVTDVATTNLITNPSFEAGLAGWGAYGTFTGSLLSRALGEGRVGQHAMRITLPTAAAFYVTGFSVAAGAFLNGDTASGSLWVKAVPGKNLTLRIYVDAVAGAQTATAFVTTGDWQRIGVVYPALPVGTTASAVVLTIFNTNGNNGGADTGFDFLVDGAQLEKAATFSSYADGSLGAGYAWTGAADASTSTRAANTEIAAAVRELPPAGFVADLPGRNVITNPSFEIDLAGWKTYTGGAPAAPTTITRVTGRGISGAAAMLVAQNTGAVSGAQAGAECAAVALASPGEVFTVSVTLTASVAVSEYVYIYEYDSTGAYLATSKFDLFSLAANVPRRVGVSGTVTNAGTRFVGVLIACAPSSVSSNVLVDAVQMERGQATSYIDGSLGNGYLWEGTPHASPSRRLPGARMVGTGRAVLGALELPQVVTATVGTLESTTSATAVDLATVGPVVPANIGPSGRALVIITGNIYNDTINGIAIMGVAVSGATTVAQTDVDSLVLTSATVVQQVTASFVRLFTGLNPGNNVFTAKYRANTGTAFFRYRSVTVIPL